MRKLALAALAFAVGAPVYSVIGSSEASAFWDRGPTYVVVPSCSRPRVYGYYYAPGVYTYRYYTPPVYGATYYAPRAYGWSDWGWGRRGWWW